jgi:hypothetical protein
LYQTKSVNHKPFRLKNSNDALRIPGGGIKVIGPFAKIFRPWDIDMFVFEKIPRPDFLPDPLPSWICFRV